MTGKIAHVVDLTIQSMMQNIARLFHMFKQVTLFYSGFQRLLIVCICIHLIIVNMLSDSRLIILISDPNLQGQLLLF